MYFVLVAALLLALIGGCANSGGAAPPDGDQGSESTPPPDADSVARVHTPHGEVAAEIVVETESVRPGGRVEFAMVNRGEIELLTGLPYQVDRWNGHRWVKVWPDPDLVWRLIGIRLSPGGRTDSQHWQVEADTEPGRYRIAKSASYGPHGQGRKQLVCYGRFRVRAG